MSLVNIIGEVNKLAIGAFFITLLFIVHEIYRLMKETEKNKKPVIPDFVEGKYNYATVNSQILKNNAATVSASKMRSYRVVLLLILMSAVLTGGGMVGGIMYLQRSEKVNAQAKIKSPIVEYVSSEGIVLYDSQWNKIDGNKLNDSINGDKIYVGVVNIPDVNIDKARIRMNSDVWQESDETINFNQNLNIYYREYTIPEGIKGLKIEAELHKKNEGWLNR